jgi:hypothetical protein
VLGSASGLTPGADPPAAGQPGPFCARVERDSPGNSEGRIEAEERNAAVAVPVLPAEPTWSQSSAAATGLRGTASIEQAAGLRLCDAFSDCVTPCHLRGLGGVARGQISLARRPGGGAALLDATSDHVESNESKHSLRCYSTWGATRVALRELQRCCGVEVREAIVITAPRVEMELSSNEVRCLRSCFDLERVCAAGEKTRCNN